MQYLSQKWSEKYETNFAGFVLKLSFQWNQNGFIWNLFVWHLFDDLGGVFDAYFSFL